MQKRTIRGFTLLELMVVIAVVGVIASLGIPSLRQFQLNNRMVAFNNDLLGAFALARTEAIKRKQSVVVCASNNSLEPVPLCGATASDTFAPWQAGWIVFTDKDEDVVFNAGVDELIRAGGPPPGNNESDPQDSGNIRVRTNSSSEYFAYKPTGYGRGDVLSVDALSAAYIYDFRGNTGDPGSVSAARVMLVSAAGRPQLYREPQLINQICNDAVFDLTCPNNP